jgi:hypothetical protein
MKAGYTHLPKEEIEGLTFGTDMQAVRTEGRSKAAGERLCQEGLDHSLEGIKWRGTNVLKVGPTSHGVEDIMGCESYVARRYFYYVKTQEVSHHDTIGGRT